MVASAESGCSDGFHGLGNPFCALLRSQIGAERDRNFVPHGMAYLRW